MHSLVSAGFTFLAFVLHVTVHWLLLAKVLCGDLTMISATILSKIPWISQKQT